MTNCNDCYEDGIPLPTANKPTISAEANKWLQDELYRIQVEMYEKGKLDALKALQETLPALSDDLFKREIIMQFINKAILLINEQIGAK